ncbi:glycosyltransferase family 4 protein [Pendulispora albinea]|uniref:Glycosyltransferase family 4 protein n=1 Tax=Pendulispora albinea TaxID=2741071 RepID=A0ABZ2M9V2_9BACT
MKFLDPAVVHRAVVLPRPGVIGELYAKGGVVDDLFFEQNLVENPIEPWDRPMQREDFDAAMPLKGVRLVGNVVRGARAIARLTALARRGRYDLLYCNGTNADFAGGALARTSGVPALWHVRYTSIQPVLAPLHDRLAASRGVRRIICVSRAAAALFPHCPEKVSVIHNALDVDEFNTAHVRPSLRAELGVGPEVTIFGSQGRILRRKGYIEMVRAAGLALSTLSAAERERVRFVVIGDTPQDFRPDHVAECRALAESLGISKSVHFLGFREDVKPYVADFDVAVVPSVYPDPLPRAVIESMAMGKPVIAFDVGGVAEMLADGVTGTLVHLGEAGAENGHATKHPDRGVQGLANQFVRYARDPGLRLEQGRVARMRIEKEFSGERQAMKIQHEILRAAGFVEGGEGNEELEAAP